MTDTYDIAALLMRLKATAGPASDARDFIALETALERLARQRDGLKIELERATKNSVGLMGQRNKAKAERDALAAKCAKLEDGLTTVRGQIDAVSWGYNFNCDSIFNVIDAALQSTGEKSRD